MAHLTTNPYMNKTTYPTCILKMKQLYGDEVHLSFSMRRVLKRELGRKGS